MSLNAFSESNLMTVGTVWRKLHQWGDNLSPRVACWWAPVDWWDCCQTYSKIIPSSHWGKWMEFHRNVLVMGGKKMRDPTQTFELTIWSGGIPANSFTNINTTVPMEGGCWAGAGGLEDYKTNLRTDRGHLCPQRTPRITDPRCANEGRTAPFG